MGGGAAGVQFRYNGVRAHQMRGARELRAPRAARPARPGPGGQSAIGPPQPLGPGGQRAARQTHAMLAAGLDVRARTQECWFCLSSATCEKHLITNVGNELYVTLPKGPIVPNHALIVPIEHVASMASHSARALAEVHAFVESLGAMYASLGLVRRD